MTGFKRARELPLGMSVKAFAERLKGRFTLTMDGTSHSLGPSYKHQKSISQCCLTIDTMRSHLTLLPPLLEPLIYLPSHGEMNHFKLWTKISSFFLIAFTQVIELGSEVVAVINLTVLFVGLRNHSEEECGCLQLWGKGLSRIRCAGLQGLF